MQNTDNPAFPIIDFINENIKAAEDVKDYWEENYQRPMSLHFRTMAVHRIAAFKEVLEFIEKTFEDQPPAKTQPYYGAAAVVGRSELLKAFVEKWNTDNDLPCSPVIYDGFIDEFLESL